MAADLTDANLERAYINQANFIEAYLTNVNLELTISEPRATNTSGTQLKLNFTYGETSDATIAFIRKMRYHVTDPHE
ncbi:MULTISPECIES: pentapeptide repeat-containing protein [unclassified Microcoleus]|uniref:pentapeptide repeat-containing protein n=1 Tax=unclassified Microcoleus TaxID=2642155 RepID=UPI00403F2C99